MSDWFMSTTSLESMLKDHHWESTPCPSAGRACNCTGICRPRLVRDGSGETDANMTVGTIPHTASAEPPTAPTTPLSTTRERMPITCSRCATVWYRLGDEHCMARTPNGGHCGLNFSSTQAGDRHRTGAGMDERCMSVNEMIDARKKNGSQLFRYEVIDNNVVWRIV